MRVVRIAPNTAGEEPQRPAGRARQEIDYGRRDTGYVLSAFQPATGTAFTQPAEQRTTSTWVDALEQVDAWLPPAVLRIDAILDHVRTHRTPDVSLFALAHPHWEFVFQPKDAAYLHLIAPWWKAVRSLTLAARRIEPRAPHRLARDRVNEDPIDAHLIQLLALPLRILVETTDPDIADALALHIAPCFCRLS